MFNFIKRTFVSASIYFTAITSVYAAVIALMYGSTENGGLLSAWRTLMFFAFSLAFASSNGIFRRFGRRVFAVLSHALLTGIAFYLFMILPAEIEDSTAFTGIILYYIVYTVAAVVIFSLQYRSSRKKDREKEYRPVFGRSRPE